MKRKVSSQYFPGLTTPARPLADACWLAVQQQRCVLCQQECSLCNQQAQPKTHTQTPGSLF
jgi:hypothetical protein